MSYLLVSSWQLAESRARKEQGSCSEFGGKEQNYLEHRLLPPQAGLKGPWCHRCELLGAPGHLEGTMK